MGWGEVDETNGWTQGPYQDLGGPLNKSRKAVLTCDRSNKAHDAIVIMPLLSLWNKQAEPRKMGVSNLKAGQIGKRSRQTGRVKCEMCFSSMGGGKKKISSENAKY